MVKRKLFLFSVPWLLLLAGGIFYFSVKSNQYCCGNPDTETGLYQIDHQQTVFNNQPLNFTLAQLPDIQASTVLGESDENKWIEIDLSDQKLFAHHGNNIDYQFLISGGKWAPTPTGDFRIWSKFKYTKMEGGSKKLNTYYYLPNVPYTQYFYKGYGVHGAYWHNNFGQPMSHGCVNLAIPDAEKLFYWTSPPLPSGKSSVRALADQGTRVVVHE